MDELRVIFDQYKKGFLTSEFLFAAAVVAYTAIKTAVDPARPLRDQISNLAMIGGAAIYALARTWLKTKRAEQATALASAATQTVPTPELQAAVQQAVMSIYRAPVMVPTSTSEPSGRTLMTEDPYIPSDADLGGYADEDMDESSEAADQIHLEDAGDVKPGAH